MTKRVLLALVFLTFAALTPAQRRVVLNNGAWSDAACEAFIRAQSPTLDLDLSDLSKVTYDANWLVSSVASKIGAITFTQGTDGNKPQRTRPDNLENIVNYSDQFDVTTGGWVKTNTTVTAGADPGPSGIAAGDKIVETAANGYHSVVQNFSVTAGQTYRITNYLKAAERTYVSLYFGALGNASTEINLTDGTKVSGALTPDSITDMGGGWWKIVHTRTAAASSASANCEIDIGSGAATYSYVGDTSSGIYVAAQQVQNVLASSTYLATTSFPQYRGWNGRSGVRFDGVNDVMTSASVLSNVFANNAKTALVVFTPALLSAAATQSLFRDVGGYSQFYIQNGTANLRWYNYDGSDDSRPLALTADKAAIAVGTHDGINLSFALNGVSAALLPSGNTTDLTNALSIGGLPASTFYNGTIYRLIADNSVWPAATRDRVTKCLARKYGVDLQ